MTFDYVEDSDPGPYPFPANAPVEGGGDKHVLVVDRDNCKLYETWNSTQERRTARGTPARVRCST